MNNVTEIDSLGPHFVHEAVCFYCRKKWVAVAPVGTQELECPECGKMGFARKARVFNLFEGRSGE
jgi:hypothetical protein